MRRSLIAGNWKMNKRRSELRDYFLTFFAELGENRSRILEKIDVLFAPSFPLMAEMEKLLEEKKVILGAQNFHWEFSGAYTGEVSGPMLTDYGVRMIIIGHSERRQYFRETNDLIAQKAVSAISQGFCPIICVGESLEQRESGQTEKVIVEQMKPLFSNLKSDQNIVIAYEPVWAIGTGKAASQTEAQAVHNLIRIHLRENLSSNFADATRILYGGSVNPDNIVDFMAQADIDGALVGGASLKPVDFAKIALSSWQLQQS